MDKILSGNEIINFLKEKKYFLKENFHVSSIALIGSFAKGLEKDTSDIDFLVEFDELTYHNLASLCIFLEKTFGKKVDVIRKGPYMKKKILDIMEKEAIYA